MNSKLQAEIDFSKEALREKIILSFELDNTTDYLAASDILERKSTELQEQQNETKKIILSLLDYPRDSLTYLSYDDACLLFQVAFENNTIKANKNYLEKLNKAIVTINNTAAKIRPLVEELNRIRKLEEALYLPLTLQTLKKNAAKDPRNCAIGNIAKFNLILDSLDPSFYRTDDRALANKNTYKVTYSFKTSLAGRVKALKKQNEKYADDILASEQFYNENKLTLQATETHIITSIYLLIKKAAQLSQQGYQNSDAKKLVAFCQDQFKTLNLSTHQRKELALITIQKRQEKKSLIKVKNALVKFTRSIVSKTLQVELKVLAIAINQKLQNLYSEQDIDKIKAQNQDLAITVAIILKKLPTKNGSCLSFLGFKSDAIIFREVLTNFAATLPSPNQDYINFFAPSCAQVKPS